MAIFPYDFTFISKLFGVKEGVFCAMRLFTEAEEQIEEPVQRNDDVGCYAAEDDRTIAFRG